MREFEAFQKILETSAKTGKEELLRQYDSPQLRTLLYLTYNPFITYRVKQLDMPSSYNIVQPDIAQSLEALLLLLAEHNTTPTQARGMIARLLAQCTEEGAAWVCKIIKRDLKIGITATTINKVFKGAVPTFKVQKGNPVIDKKKGTTRWHKVNYPAIIEEKFDGMRVIVACDGANVQYFTGDGNPLSLGFLDRQVLSLRPGTKFVLDSEGVALTLCQKCNAAVKSHKKKGNWQFTQALSMFKAAHKYTPSEMMEHNALKIFDFLDYDYFMSQGAKGYCEALKKRKMQLRAVFEREDRSTPFLHLVDNFVAQSKQDILEVFRTIRAQGGEGVMIKDPDALYSFRKSDDILKMKQFYTADLRVLDCLEGKPGTKNEGMLGTMLVGDGNGITGKVMGGFDDDQRIEFWLRHQRGEMVDAIVEVDYMEITGDNSLRHASFLRERPDKDEISWN